MTSSVRIITDSACDLPQNVVDELGIEVVPLVVRFGDKEFVDREQLSVAEFWEMCVGIKELPSTAAPPPGRFMESIRRLASQGATGVVIINLSGALSGTLQSAELAASNMAGEVSVKVVDSGTVSMGLGAIVVACARAARAGATLDDVENLARDLSARCKVWGALDTLENLRIGGRIGGAKALLGTILSRKPIIEVRDGIVQKGGMTRTRSAALAFVVGKVRETIADHGISQLSVLHAACDDVDQFLSQLRAVYDGEILVGEIGPVVGAHAGKGTIGVAFFVN